MLNEVKSMLTFFPWFTCINQWQTFFPAPVEIVPEVPGLWPPQELPNVYQKTYLNKMNELGQPQYHHAYHKYTFLLCNKKIYTN